MTDEQRKFFRTHRIAAQETQFRNEHGREMSPHEKHVYELGLDAGMEIEMEYPIKPESHGLDLKQAQRASNNTLEVIRRTGHGSN